MADPPFHVASMGDTTLRLVGELDMASVPMLKAELERLPAGRGHALDLAELTFLDSSGLNALSQHAKSLNGEGPLVLANVPAPIAELLAIVGFDQMGTIEIRG